MTTPEKKQSKSTPIQSLPCSKDGSAQKLTSRNDEKASTTGKANDQCDKKDDSDACASVRDKVCKSAEPKDTKRAKINKDPCVNDPDLCQLARPDSVAASQARIDPSKPGCIDYEACKDKKQDTEKCGIDYEDCNDLKDFEKLKKRRKNREKAAKIKEEALSLKLAKRASRESHESD